MVFSTLYGQPWGPTEHIVPTTPDCRQELSVIQGINQYYQARHTDIVLYGSCELMKAR